jgi:hypothetical protein
MNTLIVSAFPACGRSYLTDNQNKLEFKYNGKVKRFSFLNIDSQSYDKTNGWESKYVKDIKERIGNVDFIFISQHSSVLRELYNNDIPFVVVSPNNAEWEEDKDRQLTKQQWFGRIVLRDNSRIKDINSYLKRLKDNYDEWTSLEHLAWWNPMSVELLDSNEYLSDIIENLYWRKEHYSSSFINLLN